MAEKKQKILIVHNYYQIPGGEDTVVANEKNLLESHGHNVYLYTRHNKELNQFSKWQKLMLPVNTVFNFQTYKEIRTLIEKESIDIVHVHNTLNLISPSVYYAALSKKKPIVQTIHNFRLLCPGATFFRNGHVCEECLRKGLSCAVKYKCYRNSRMQTLACVVSTVLHRCFRIYGKLNYICLTPFNKEKLLSLKQIKEDKVFVKPNFVQKAECIHSHSERKNYYIYVGRLEEIKGIDTLLDAWKCLGEAAPELLICGKGPLEEWCKEYITKEKLTKVQLLGFVPNEQVRKLIGESKALILPTRVYEGFPMTIAESYAMGTPVIGTDLGNTGSLIEHGKTGYKFPLNQAEALAEFVQKEMPTLEKETIEKYSEESNYMQLREIYEACCNYN